MIYIKYTKMPVAGFLKRLAAFICMYIPVASHATVITYPQLSGMQVCQYAYTLQARDHGTTTWNSVPLYSILVTNTSGTQLNSTVGNFDCSGSTDVQITFSTTVTSAAIYPASLNVTPTISGNTITFTIAGPKKFYVDINGDHYGNCIHVCADSIEVNPPQQGDSNVVYIPTGTFSTSGITLTSGQTLYIQGGAAVVGVFANGVSNVKILGRGFIYRASYNAIEVKGSSNITINGPIELNHGWGGGGGCGINCAQSSNVYISNTMSFSSKKWGDGYDIFCSNGVSISDVFIRTNDDAITFYGGGKSGYTGDCQNITVSNSTLVPDLAHSINVGIYGDTAGVGKQIRDVMVSNIDICNQSRTTSSGCINFSVGDKIRAANLKFQDIRVQGFLGGNLITMNIIYNSTYDYNPGRAIDSVYFMNVSYTGSGTPASSINGYDASRRVTNVFFNNLVINGSTITGPTAGNFGIGSNTSNINFSSLAAGGTYFFAAKNSGKSANINGGSTSSGALVVQNTYGGASYQKWVLEDAGSGYYKFKNVNSGLYMDVWGGFTTDGDSVIQWTSASGLNQQFQLLPQDSGYFAIIARHSGKFLGVNGASTSDGAKIIQGPGTGSTSQLWLLQPALDTGTYVLKCKHSGLAANVRSGSTAAGAVVVQNTYSGGAWQKWVLENAGNGYYKFKNANSGLYMDLNNGLTTDGDSVIQWTSSTGFDQQFYLVAQGNGYYNIIAHHSNKCLDVNGASTSEGATIIQWPGNGSDNQSWLIQLASGVRMIVNTPDSTNMAGADSRIKGFAIYPNPSTNMLYINWPNPNGANVEIYDQQGKLIFIKRIWSSVDTVNMTGMPAGIYFMRIDDGKQQASKKIVKM